MAGAAGEGVGGWWVGVGGCGDRGGEWEVGVGGGVGCCGVAAGEGCDC